MSAPRWDEDLDAADAPKETSECDGLAAAIARLLWPGGIPAERFEAVIGVLRVIDELVALTACDRERASEGGTR